eukprot:g13593.t1
MPWYKPIGFQPLWLGRWFALLKVLPRFDRGRGLQITNERRCALGRYLYEELGDPGAGELLRKVPPKSWRSSACACAAEVFRSDEEMTCLSRLQTSC